MTDELHAQQQGSPNPAPDAGIERVESAALARRDGDGTRLERTSKFDPARAISAAAVDGMVAAGTLSAIARSRSVRGWSALLFTEIVLIANRTMRRWAPPASAGLLEGA
ncbi:MAG: hypothetical protein AB7P03_28265 [Kofleriaceae bacterium]